MNCAVPDRAKSPTDFGDFLSCDNISQVFQLNKVWRSAFTELSACFVCLCTLFEHRKYYAWTTLCLLLQTSSQT